ncbi:WD40 repeat domain-containing serine/threonine protein kinase [Fuerstiella marisgermanici]|uniref:Serine/threonine-protein kinase PknB n=1 Tax=Fuerstiella marisgermanici TaxID=1891926 RepID=A0A1P8WNC8_9PLAN|nr:WD40 repeat domain-containing serine/threonine protein kinase [Fuerstiella marisgermanici]APZ95548.1 Serine/threonine-protein kinase PknB [Fuerstiella marisgermanici]
MTTTLKTSCPSCGKRLRINEANRDKTVRCPACRETFVASDVSEASQMTMDTTEAAVSVDTTQLAKSQTLSDLVSPAAQNSEEQTLRKLGRFELKSVLGAGGFGKVYRAYDPQLERFVAIKVPTFGPGDKRRRRRFVTEARSAAKLHHPNIVTVYENGQTNDGRLYIATEFVAGCTLKEVLLEEQPTLNQRVEWVRDLASALHYAHSEGIIHRDIKPENILIDRATSRAKIADFGLAKVLDDQSTDAEGPQQTQDGILGTPAFMSPEQARGTLSEVGPHSDQYSLGAVLYQCLTGKPPFTGSTYLVVAAVAGDNDPTHVRQIDDSVSSDLAAICEKAMNKVADWRYADCEKFSDDLDRWLEGEPVVARPLAIVQRGLRIIKRNPVPSALGALVGLLLIAVTVVASISRSRAIEDRDAFDQQRLAAVAAEKDAQVAEERANRLNRNLQKEKELAELQTQEALDAKNELKSQLAESERLRKALQSSDSRVVAEQELRTLSEAKERSGRYQRQLEKARVQIKGGRFVDAQATLQQTPEEQRHFEFNYLTALASPFLGPFEYRTDKGDVISSLAVSPNQSQLAFLTSSGRLEVHSSARHADIGSLIPNERWDARDSRVVFYGEKWLVVSVQTISGRIQPFYCNTRLSPLTVRPLNEKGTNESQVASDPYPVFTRYSERDWPSVRMEGGKHSYASPVPSMARLTFPNRWATTGYLDLDSDGRMLQIRRGTERKLVKQIRQSDSPTFATASPSGSTVMCGLENGDVSVYSYKLDKAKRFAVYKGDGHPITAGVFGGKGTVFDFELAFASDSQLVIHSNAARDLFRCVNHGCRITRLQFVGNRRKDKLPDWLFAVTDKNEVFQVDINNRRSVRNSSASGTSVPRPMASPTDSSKDMEPLWYSQERGKWLVFSDDGHKVIINPDADTEFPIPTLSLSGHVKPIIAASLSPDYRRVVTFSEDLTVRIWDADSGVELLRIRVSDAIAECNGNGGSLMISGETLTLRLPQHRCKLEWGDFRDRVTAAPLIRNE